MPHQSNARRKGRDSAGNSFAGTSPKRTTPGDLTHPARNIILYEVLRL